MIMSIARLILGNWQIAAGVLALLVASHTLAYCEGRSHANAKWEAKLLQAQFKAEANATEARQQADGIKRDEAEKFEAQQDVLKQVIDDAKANDSNALDGLLSGLSSAD